MDNPGVKFPPPTLFVLGFVASWLLETRVQRIPMGSEPKLMTIMQIGGVVLLIAGIAFIFWGLFTFWRVKTGILPMRPATRIVDHGPYGFSRNPMYTGMSAAYLGGAFILGWAWMLITLPLVVFALYHLVIKREERYLSSAFPEEYASYCGKVRRWL